VGSPCSRALLACVLAALSAQPAFAQTIQQAESANYNGQDFTRPENSVETRLQFRESYGDQSRTDREMLRLRYSTRIPLDNGWKIGAYAEVPYSLKQIEDTSSGATEHINGLDDVTIQAALIQALNARWAYGFGLRVLAPTGAEKIGANEWQIQPGVGVRVSFQGQDGDSYFVPVLRYSMSSGGGRRISEPEFAPTLNLGLSNRWFVTFYPSNDIRVNFGERISGQTGRLFLPFDVAAGKKISDTLSASLEVSAPVIDDYPVYKFKAELRLVMQLP
jgi:Putative MetA-pathway of phenol degradation